MNKIKLNWGILDEDNKGPSSPGGIDGWAIGEWFANLDEEYFKRVRVYQIKGDQVGDEYGKWYFLISTEHYMDLRNREWGVYCGGFDTDEIAKEMAEKWLNSKRRVKENDHSLHWAIFEEDVNE